MSLAYFLLIIIPGTNMASIKLLTTVIVMEIKMKKK